MRLDEIGYWTEVKLDIVRDYASAYSRIMAAHKLRHIYIDAFAGAGVHISKTTGEFIKGSPLNALSIQPAFDEFHLIDIDGQKTRNLRDAIGERRDVYIYEGDCNSILLDRVFPRARYEDYRRALCLLDPYGLHLDWKVVCKAGAMRTIDIFLTFQVMDMNMNVLWRNPERVSAEQVQRMNRFWGDESWREYAYTTESTLFPELPTKAPTEVVAHGFQQRLKEVAGFQYVPDPVPMRNTKNAVVYYLFFGSQKPVAKKIVADIFKKYRDRQG